MIRPTTLDGTKDILTQYGKEYCIVYAKIANTLNLLVDRDC